MIKSPRIIWSDAENRSVAAAVYRQFKSDFESHPDTRSMPGSRPLTEKDVELGQITALNDSSRHKPTISVHVLATISQLVQEIVSFSGMKEVKSRMVESAAVISKPVTIDLQIRSLVKSELLSHQPFLLARIEDLLHSHERNIANMLLQQEQRLMAFWGGTSPTGDGSSLVPSTETLAVKATKLRVLVACLRRDQHHLITNRLVEVNDRLEVVILDQDDGFVGIKQAYFDRVLILTGLIGHSHFEKIKSIFRKDQIVVKKGAALTAASTLISMLESTDA
jgi:hypothetical protein